MSGIFHVAFPGLGIGFEINNQIQIFGLSIYWYGIIIATGLVLAVVYGCLNAKRLGITADNLLNCVIVGVITGILGARLYYVLFNLDYYSANPSKIMAINEGGLAIYGGIIGALLGGLIVAKICKMNIPALLDVAAIGFLIGQGIGRWGNFFNQEAFGTATSLPWGMVSEGTNGIVVHPCFLYESIWCLLGALLLHLFSKSKYRKYHGQVGLLYMVWYGAERAVVEGLRTDSLMIGEIIRVSQVLSIIMVVVGIALLVYFHVKKYNNLSTETAVEAEGEINEKAEKIENIENSESTADADKKTAEAKTAEKPQRADTDGAEDKPEKTAGGNVNSQKNKKAKGQKKPSADKAENDNTNAEANAEDDEENDAIDISSFSDKEIDNILSDIKNIEL